MRCRGYLSFLVRLVSIVLLTGCGASSSTVDGEVTLDGKPLDKGIISYVPADGAGVPATVSIQNGKYELRTTPGKKVVQISAPIVTGKRKLYEGPDAPLEDITDERVPERFNSHSELMFDVKGGNNTKSWSVESKRRKP